MRALSLTQPWPWIVLHLGKRIENRSRNIGNYRGPVLLHAAQRCTASDWSDAFEFVRMHVGAEAARSIPRPRDLIRGAIVGRCQIVGQFDARTGLVQVPVEPVDWSEQKARWYMGQHGYLLSDVQAAPIVQCKGALGFWRVPADVLRALDALEASCR